MTSQPGKKAIAIHILPNISRSKGNQTMKFGQLIEYNMKNIFLKKSYTKCDGQTILRPFSKTSNLSLSLRQYSFIQFTFIVCQAEGYRNILKLSCRPLTCTFFETFLKNKKRSGTCLPDSFSV